jgi:hypothetical protein
METLKLNKKLKWKLKQAKKIRTEALNLTQNTLWLK